MPHWYGYGDASEIPLNDNRTALRPLAVLWVGLFAVACAVAALLPPPPSSGVVPKDVAESEPALTPENAGAPGAMTALINLKLAANALFQDNAGACKLIETAVARGDQSMAPRLSECRAG